MITNDTVWQLVFYKWVSCSAEKVMGSRITVPAIIGIHYWHANYGIINALYYHYVISLHIDKGYIGRQGDRETAGGN